MLRNNKDNKKPKERRLVAEKKGFDKVHAIKATAGVDDLWKEVWRTKQLLELRDLLFSATVLTASSVVWSQQSWNLV